MVRKSPSYGAQQKGITGCLCGYDDADPKEKRIVERCRVRSREVHDATMVICLDEPDSSDFHDDCASPAVGCALHGCHIDGVTILEISRVAFLIYFMIGRLRNKMRSVCSEFCWVKCACFCLLRGLSECHVHSLWSWFLHSTSLQSVPLQSDAGSDGALRTVETGFLW